MGRGGALDLGKKSSGDIVRLALLWFIGRS